jgi:hypothetical protein
MVNLFSLHGKYYRDDENRLTANTVFLLSECRATFLSALLPKLGITIDASETQKVQIIFQPHDRLEEGLTIPDAEIRLPDPFRTFLEAKVGRNTLCAEQLRFYARNLALSAFPAKRLVCVTQIADNANFSTIRSQIEPAIVPDGTCVYIRWFELLNLLKDSLRLDAGLVEKTNKYISSGRNVDYAHRMAALFLQEVEATMYDKKVIAELPCEEVDDIIVTTHEPWFMKVAKEHNVWFPPGSLPYGLRPARYVAFYETADIENENPKSIGYLAPIRIMWNRITLGDARQVPELEALFSDKEVDAKIRSWYKEEDTFHVALTGQPVKLSRPIPLGKKNVARVLTKRRYQLPDLLNANTVDDLFP